MFFVYLFFLLHDSAEHDGIVLEAFSLLSVYVARTRVGGIRIIVFISPYRQRCCLQYFARRTVDVESGGMRHDQDSRCVVSGFVAALVSRAYRMPFTFFTPSSLVSVLIIPGK